MKTNRGVRFPVSPFNEINGFWNIEFDVDDLQIFQNNGKYFQSFSESKIIIGKGTWIAANVGIITVNHDVNNLVNHVNSKDVIIGRECWVGMNSMILPGVILGNKVVVGAGSVVTKSFPEGNCIIAGNPAKIIKFL